MARIPRCCPAGTIQHVLSRGNDRKKIFLKREDYWAFLRLMAEAQLRIPLLILAYCLMPNHFHIVVLAHSDVAVSEYMHWLLTTHVRRYHHHYGTTGTGHIYQSRFRNFFVQPGVHLINVLRYVEANAVRASLVRRAEDWTWSSLKSTCPDARPTLSVPPTERPADWLDYVNGAISLEELYSVRRSVIHGAPYGDAEWVTGITQEYGLESTIRRPGPRKVEMGTVPVLSVL
jgi:REP-associated tyrosine transposase